jgi:hypothetical protein
MKTNAMSRWRRSIELVLPWLVLGVLLMFTFVKFVETPYVGFDFSSGIVTLVSTTSEESLQVDDRLISVGDVHCNDLVSALQDGGITDAACIGEIVDSREEKISVV